jgi:hypothetical protein
MFAIFKSALTFLTHSSVNTENHNHVDTVHFTKYDLRINLLKLRYKVMKHSVYNIHIHGHVL